MTGSVQHVLHCWCFAPNESLAVTGGLFLLKLRLNRKFFTLLYFSLLFSTSTFAFSFLLFGSNFHASFFQVSIVRFQISRFQISRFCFPSFWFSTSIFTLLLFRCQLSSFCWRFRFSRFSFVNFLRKQMLVFNGFLLRNFGFQLPLNVFGLCEGWD